jgi:hypothetical protein
MGVLGDPFESYSYFRRAIRADELFFVVSPEGGARLASATPPTPPRADP